MSITARLPRIEFEMRGAALAAPVLGGVEQRLAVPRGPVVRVHGEHEEAFTRDLVWGPSDLLGGLAGGLRVEELPRGSNGNSDAYWLAMKLRKRWRAEWPGRYWYYAIFADQTAALDLANAHALVRTNAADDSDEHSFRDGEWSCSSVRRDIGRGKSDDEYLPISPDEAQRLMELRGGRRP